MGEGTFLRRNLLLVFGLTDFGIAYIFNSHNEFFLTTYGADASPFVLMLMVEGLAYLSDALFRKRVKK